MTEEDKAYLAGFFDGEGWATTGESNGFYIRVAIGQTHLEVLVWIQAIFGGRLSQNLQPDNHLSKKPMHRWEISGQAAYEVLKIIRPYLKVKAVVADLVMRAFEVRKDHPARDAAMIAFKQRDVA